MAAATERGWPYRVLDVFTRTPLEGNPVAVFPDAGGIDDATMQRIARELNLSETVFVVPAGRADCAARLRIFTPSVEMAFAGHPTIGACAVLLKHGLVEAGAARFAVEEGVGPVPIRVEREPGHETMFWLTTPPIGFGPTFEPAACARALNLDEAALLPGVPPQLATAGNPNLYVAVRSRADVDRAATGPSEARALRAGEPPFCLFVFTPTADGAYARMFAPELGVAEDPATGSAAGPLAAYMMRHGLAPHADGTRLVSEQGTRMGRRSLLHLLVHGDHGCEGIEVGGTAVPVAAAVMTLPTSG